jgi:hypothetical protein
MATPASHTFSVYQGQTWADTITIREPDGTATNLTGYGARMHIREDVSSTTTILELTTTNGRLVIAAPLTGQVAILVSAADMAALSLNYETQVWQYDLEIYRTSPSPEYVQKVLQGWVIINPEVTR